MRPLLGAALLVLASPVCAEILGARYVNPTDVYGHGVVPGGEYAALEVTLSPDRILGVSTDQNVYEDSAPRLVDLDGDGLPEIITVISDFEKGAAVRVWAEVVSADHPLGSTIAIIAETDPIGTRHRWLAIVGAADLDGDGVMEIAYVDRPHLAKTLRIVQIQGDKLVEVAAVSGVTNHRIGERDIGGGIRNCGDGPQLIVATADWSRVLAVSFDGTGFSSSDLGPYNGRPSFQSALDCAN